MAEIEVHGRAMLPDGSHGLFEKTTRRVIKSLIGRADTRTMAAVSFHAESVESLRERIRVAVYERQALRASVAGREDLERNRLEIVELQRRLSDALIARFLPAA